LCLLDFFVPTPLTKPKSVAVPPTSAPANADWWRHPVALAGLLLLVVVVAYLPALRAGFIWDDDAYVTQNPMVTDPHGLREIWFSAHKQSQYFPLVYTTFRLEHALWGFNPLGYHLVNVLLHGVNAVLVWLVLRRLLIPGAWLAAAFFALHPVQVESVAWVTELKNIESLLFYLLAVLAWLQFDDSAGPRRWGWYGLTSIAYLLALFAKTTACTLPAALVLVLWLRGRRFTWSWVPLILPFLAAGFGLGLLTVWWEGHLGNFNQDFAVSLNPLQRLLLAGRALWFYAGKLTWPVGLTFSYPHWDINPAELWQYLPWAGCLAVAFAAWRWRNQIGRAPIAGLVFFVAALSPLLGFIMEYTFRYSYVADHYQYTASIGLLAVAVAALVRLLAGTNFLPLVSGAVLLALGGLTWQQCGAYQNFETLWRDTVAKNPQSWMAHHNLGIELSLLGNNNQALIEYQAAVALHPNGDVEQADLGGALLQEGRNAEAVPHLEAAAAINPKLFAVQNNLALAYANAGNLDQAVNHFKLALQITNAPGTLMNFGGVLVRQGNWDEAVKCYRQVAAIWPAQSDPWRRLGGALVAKNDLPAAVAALREGLLATSNHPDLLLDLGNFYFRQTNYVGATECFENALKKNPASAGLHYNLAIIYGQQGDLEAERRELQTTVDLKPDFTEAKLRLLLLPKAQPK
jgi:tetratricopeptide (TPR) repeat protein